MTSRTQTEAGIVARAIKEHGSLRAAVPDLRKRYGWTYHRCRTLTSFAVQLRLMEPLRPRSARREDVTGKIPVADGHYKTSRRSYGTVKAKAMEKLRLPARGKVHYHLFTCAQNNTKVHSEFWKNLEGYAKYLEATIHVARITYKKDSYTSQHTKDKLYRDTKAMWWDEKVVSSLDDSRLEVAPGLVWCGDVDILPTAERPLQGMETFTGRRSSIFPHMKQDMDSIPSNKFEPTKFVYTTGTVTLRNYIQRKVGQKADFHHHFGAMIVEVDDAGNWYARQINADSTGAFYDWDVQIKDGTVWEVPLNKAGARPGYSIYWGDGHEIESDDEMVSLAFDKDGFKDQIRPEKDFQGDIISFLSQNHHNTDNPHVRAIVHANKQHKVETEVEGAGRWLRRMARDYCITYAVYGNHERAIGKWLKKATWSIFDPTNAEFWSRLQAETFAYIREHRCEPNYFELALEVAKVEVPKNVRFLLEDESVILNPDANGGIECGAYHGDTGPGGTRGTARGFARTGRKINIGDKHAAQKIDGVCVSGTFSDMNKVPWCHGPNAWSCTQILGYPNGKRALVTFWNGKARA